MPADSNRHLRQDATKSAVRTLMTVPWRTLICAGCFVAAFTATHIPPGKLPTEILLSDKIKHLAGYFVLAFVTLWRQNSGKPRPKWVMILSTVALLAIYGIIDELTQPWFGRDCELADWLSDMGGVVLASAAWLGWKFLASSRIAK